ncbi:MAG: PqqD family protein [Candidatus Aminicenantes bacterium]|nr:PqqD family protein [Candidatus Aminicenantes bacterium]
MNLGRRFRRNERIAGRRIAGESFLIPVCGTPLDMENIFILNPLADFIWERLDGEQTLDAIVAEIIAEFDVTAGKAGADAREFVGQLQQKGLVEEVA